MVNQLALSASLTHIDDLRRHADAARAGARADKRISLRRGLVQRFGSSYRLQSGRWIHGTR